MTETERLARLICEETGYDPDEEPRGWGMTRWRAELHNAARLLYQPTDVERRALARLAVEASGPGTGGERG